MTLVLAVELAPMALFAVPGGIVAERLGARTTMMVCDAARIPLLAALPLLHSADLLGLPLLLALVFAANALRQREPAPATPRSPRELSYGTASRAHRFSSIRRTGQSVAEPPKSRAPPANTFAPAAVS